MGERIGAVTPARLARLLLGAGALLGLLSLIGLAWGSLLPFVAGAAIAYVLLPLVNLLDRYLPRLLAVLLVMGLVAMLAGFILSLIVPLIARQLYEVYQRLPSRADVATFEVRLSAYLATLPAPTQTFVRDVLTQLYDKARANIDVYLAQTVALTIEALFGLVNTLGVVLGLIVVPTWLLAVLVDQPRARSQLDRALPTPIRTDIWAVVRIIDRALSAFVRGQLLIACITGGLVYLGLDLLARLFGLTAELRYLLLLAILAGLAQLVPSVGPFLGALPPVLIALSLSPQLTVAVVVLLILVQQVIGAIVAPRFERNVIDLHPGILILVVVALSQFGFWWILLAAPVTAITRDLFRYIYGRFGEPPRPAGLLPGEALASIPMTSTAGRRTALVYRRTALLRRMPPDAHGERSG